MKKLLKKNASIMKIREWHNAELISRDIQLENIAKEVTSFLETKNLSTADVCNIAEKIKYVAMNSKFIVSEMDLNQKNDNAGNITVHMGACDIDELVNIIKARL
ncbi:MAG: hypothetical protein N4A40_01590 [Tissierellales bacterium]|jgi:hypothetical protein|nr:hypothetical protein [Tissierellales bacterium]